MAWILQGNIKGPSGDVGGIPDPLVLNEIKANNTLYIDDKMRFVKLVNGGRLEILNSSSVWITQVEWTEP